MEKQEWRGYFVCPVCEHENILRQWKMNKESPFTLEFEANNYVKMCKFRCENCGAFFEFGLKLMKIK